MTDPVAPVNALDRCGYVHPGEEHLGACGVDRYAHDAITGHEFVVPIPDRFPQATAFRERFGPGSAHRPSRLPLHRTEANHGVVCSTCDGGGCLDCTDPA